MTGPPAKPSLLVLPFANLSAEGGHDYFSEGLTDQLIDDLSSVESLRVISPASSRLLGQSDRPLVVLARDVNVRFALEGQVRRAGDLLRVTASLVDAPAEIVVWSDTYTGHLADVFAIQESISTRIVGALRVELSEEKQRELAAPAMPDVQAYELYLRARHEALKYTEEGLEQALDYLESAARRVGNHELVLSAMGQVCWQFFNACVTSDTAYLDRAEHCATTILERRPDSANGLRLSGLVRVLRGNMEDGIRVLQQALEFEPHHPETLGWLVVALGVSGRVDAARPLLERLLTIDPLTPVYQALPGVLDMMNADFEQAVEPIQRALARQRDNVALHLLTGQALAMAGRVDEAVTEFEALAKSSPDGYFGTMGKIYAAALRGDRDRARAWVTDDLGRRTSGPRWAWQMAQCYALVDDRERALDWLGRAVDRGFANHRLLAGADPLLANVREEPRLAELARTARRRSSAIKT